MGINIKGLKLVFEKTLHQVAFKKNATSY